MNHGTRLGFSILAVALLLGIWGDQLLSADPWGLNVFLFIAPLVLLALLLAARLDVYIKGQGAWMSIPLLLFAAGFAWRDSPTLKTLDGLAVLISISLAVFWSRKGELSRSGILDYLFSLLAAGYHAISGMLPLIFSDIRWKEIPREGWTRNALAVTRGLLIALPLLLLFGALFAAADAVFEHLLSSTFRINPDEVISHLFLAGFCTWIIAGLLRTLLLREGPLTSCDTRPQAFSLGIMEIGIVLGLLDLLFLLFVVIQVRYFFGGTALVEATTGLTYAVYARQGFFELAAAASLVLPLLLSLHWLLRKESRSIEYLFRTLAGVQVLLLFVIMASALQRMRLYDTEYGLTELRFYTTSFMCWLGVVFLWFCATVLRGRREPFAIGALLAGFAAIALLHFLNPDALIVGANMVQCQAGRRLDTAYATSLSADAVPTLLEDLRMLPPQESQVVASYLIRSCRPPAHPDWRSWNWSQAKAWMLVGQNEQALTALSGQGVSPR